jgi:ammonia channel protein AmtB
MAGAAAALAGVILLGARKGKYGPKGEIRAFPGANLPLATLGTFILWMGWFGFNGGSTLKLGGIGVANEVANVFLNTNAAAAGGLIAALIVARLMFGKADLTMTLNGALAGLVAITAEPATPSPLLATVIGAIGGTLVVFSIVTMDKLRIDDPVGAISVHGVVGIWGIFGVRRQPDRLGDPQSCHGHQGFGRRRVRRCGSVRVWHGSLSGVRQRPAVGADIRNEARNDKKGAPRVGAPFFCRPAFL